MGTAVAPYFVIVKPRKDDLRNMKGYFIANYDSWDSTLYCIYCDMVAWCVSWPHVTLWLVGSDAFAKKTLQFPATFSFLRELFKLLLLLLLLF